MADKQTFETVLRKHGKLDATDIEVPFDVEALFGAKQVRIKAVINDAEYFGSIVRMGGKYLLGVPKVFRQAAEIKTGDNIVVTIEIDSEPRTVAVPKDLKEALHQNRLRGIFDAVSYTNRKVQVRAVEDAKAPEILLRRIETAVAMMAAEKK